MRRNHSKEKILIIMEEEQRSKQDLDKETEGNANKENKRKTVKENQQEKSLNKEL